MSTTRTQEAIDKICKNIVAGAYANTWNTEKQIRIPGKRPTWFPAPRDLQPQLRNGRWWLKDKSTNKWLPPSHETVLDDNDPVVQHMTLLAHHCIKANEYSRDLSRVKTYIRTFYNCKVDFYLTPTRWGEIKNTYNIQRVERQQRQDQERNEARHEAQEGQLRNVQNEVHLIGHRVQVGHRIQAVGLLVILLLGAWCFG